MPDLANKHSGPQLNPEFRETTVFAVNVSSVPCEPQHRRRPARCRPLPRERCEV